MKIAILEDEKEIAQQTSDYVNQYANEHNLFFVTKIFPTGFSLLDDDISSYDIFLMDICVPGMDGMEVAKNIREKNNKAVIMFITNLSNYALLGYSVQALDYILKPVSYESFAFRFSRAVNYLQSNTTKYVKLQVDKSSKLFDLNDILFFQIYSHEIVVYTVSGQFRTYGSLKQIEESLKDPSFVRCDACSLVNLKHVRELKKDTLVVGDFEVKMSRNKKKLIRESMKGLYL